MLRAGSHLRFISNVSQSTTRCHTSKLLEHPFFASVSLPEAAEHLGLFIGRSSEWRKKGLPWRLYRPSIWGVGREISAIEALNLLSENQPVRLQRRRVVTVVPDLKIIKSLATGLAIPGLKNVASSAKATNVTPATSGLETSFGLPTTLSSLAELKLFSAIVNDSVKLPDGNDTELLVAKHISELMNREMSSGLDFFSCETHWHRRFVYHFKRKFLFWAPVGGAAVLAMSSNAAMGQLGLEALSLFPGANMETATLAMESAQKTAASLTSSSAVPASTSVDTTSFVKEVDKLTKESFFETAIGVSTIGTATIAALTSVWSASFTPLGFRLSAYAAFLSLTQGIPIVLQEVVMHTIRVPFITTLSWFTNYRPGEKCENLEQLRRFHQVYLFDAQRMNEKINE